MPKICKHTHSFRIDSANKHVETEIHYSSKEGFYAQIPSEYNDVFDSLDREVREHHSLEMQHKSKKRVAYGKTEAECKSNFNNACKFLTQAFVQKRNVIIIYFVDDYGFDSSERYNKDHEKIGMGFGLAYGVETTIQGNKPTYAVHVPHEYDSQFDRMININVYNWDKKAKVIDDTPENRLFLEDLYERFKTLREKLTSLVSTPESILQFIESKQKLLN